MWWNSRRGPDLRSWYVSWSINRVLFLVTNKCLMLQFRYCLSWFVIISVAAVAACISCSGFLPPTLLGSSKPGHCFSPRCAIYWTWSCWWACWWFWTWALWPRVTPMRMPRCWLQLGANGRRESVRPYWVLPGYPKCQCIIICYVVHMVLSYFVSIKWPYTRGGWRIFKHTRIRGLQYIELLSLGTPALADQPHRTMYRGNLCLHMCQIAMN